MVLGVVGIAHAMRPETPDTPPPVPQRPVHTHGPLRAEPDVIMELRQRRREERAHDHTRMPGVACLLCLPIFLALLVPPPPLGAYAAARGGAIVAKPAGGGRFPALAPGDPVSLPVYDYAERAVWDHRGTLANRKVALTGFVTPSHDGGWYLTRMRVTCCAADARSYVVDAAGATKEYPANTWLRVTGTVTPSTHPGVARISIATVTRIHRPQDPYEQ
jgi:uncharacterized repeat protein (TIGR03943 family)